MALAIQEPALGVDAALVLIEVDYSRLSDRLDLVRNTSVKKIATMPPGRRVKLAENFLSGQK